MKALSITKLLPTEALVTDSQADLTLSFGIGDKVIRNFGILTSLVERLFF